MRMTCSLVVASLVAVIAGCGGDGATGPGIESVEVAPATASVAPGGTVQLTATALSDLGVPVTGARFTWTSSNDGVATVSSSGLVTGVADGSATITASAGGESGSATITVVSPVASVDVTPEVATIRAGSTTQLTATPKDADGNPLTGRTITWSSSDDAIATVSATGLVTGVNNGTATITAEVEGQSGAADIAVWVGVTGTWQGTITAFGETCGLTFSWTEDLTGAFTGDGQLIGPPCVTVAVTFEGVNNTGGVADSVTFTMSSPGLPDVLFWGNFDGVSTITGFFDANLGNGTLTASRGSIIPSAPPVAAGAVVDSHESVKRSYAWREGRLRR